MSFTNRSSTPPAPGSRRRASALLAGVVGLVALVVLPVEAQAAVHPAPAARSHAAAERPGFSASSCPSKVTVSQIVGWSVPAPTTDTLSLPATAKNDHIASKQSDCIYGSEDSLADLPKLIVLVTGTTSKPITSADLRTFIASAQAGAAKEHLTYTPYPGVGSAAWYFEVSVGQFVVRGITAVQGTTIFGASTASRTLAVSKIATLSKLAQGL